MLPPTTLCAGETYQSQGTRQTRTTQQSRPSFK